jgi:hypothetical protein
MRITSPVVMESSSGRFGMNVHCTVAGTPKPVRVALVKLGDVASGLLYDTGGGARGLEAWNGYCCCWVVGDLLTVPLDLS